MLEDGQRIFRDDAAKRERFILARIKELVSTQNNVNGQETLGVLTGTVTDGTNGLILENVEVSIPELSLTATSDSEGVYLLEDIAPGTYNVEYNLAGYDNLTQDNIEIGEETLTLNVELQPAS